MPLVCRRWAKRQTSNPRLSSRALGSGLAVSTSLWAPLRNTVNHPPQMRGYLNQELVKQGWWYRKYVPVNTVLEGLEKDAREAKKGLWTDPQPMPP